MIWAQKTDKTGHRCAALPSKAKVWIGNPWLCRHTVQTAHGSRQKTGTANSSGHVAKKLVQGCLACSADPVRCMQPGFEGEQAQQARPKQNTSPGCVVGARRKTPFRQCPQHQQQHCRQCPKLPIFTVERAILGSEFGGDEWTHEQAHGRTNERVQGGWFSNKAGEMGGKLMPARYRLRTIMACPCDCSSMDVNRAACPARWSQQADLRQTLMCVMNDKACASSQQWACADMATRNRCVSQVSGGRSRS